MAKISRVTGSTSNILEVFIQDSSKTDGSGLAGLLFNTSGLTAYYKRNKGSASVLITLVTITTLGTFASSGFKEVDAVNMPGMYEFDPPDAALVSGSDSVVFYLRGATNMAPLLLEIELTAINNQDAVRYGLTALPNVASGSAGAIITSGTGTAQLAVSSGNVALTSAGIDNIVVESGLNARQALSIQSSALAGVFAGGGTTSVTIAAAGVSATNRISATVDAQGNRSSVTLAPPA